MGSSDFRIEGDVLVRYSGRARTVIVPDGVRVIGERAFMRNDLLEKIALPEGVREIREEAFSFCGHLAGLHLPDSLESIGRYAFSCCERLRQVRIPSGVRALEGEAFFGCAALKEVALPDRLASFGPGVFLNCSSLKEIRIPPQIVRLPAGLFRCCGKLERVQLAEGLRSIGSRAFENCLSLQELRLPSTLEYLSDTAFVDCSNLTRVFLPVCNPRLNLTPLDLAPIKYLELPQRAIGELDAWLRLPAARGLAVWEYRGNTLSPELEESFRSYLAGAWPTLLGEVGENLPLLIALLRRDILPRESVEVLLDRLSGPEHAEAAAALLDCLDRLPAPDPAEREAKLMRELETGYLSEAAFDASWRAAHDKEGRLILMEYHGAGGDLFLPAGRGTEPVYGLDRQLLWFRKDIRSLHIPEGIRTIGFAAFFNCTALQSVELPSTTAEIPNGAFQGCNHLTSVRLSPGLKAIRESAFLGCEQLQELGLPEGLTQIGKGAFWDCTRLSQVSLPASLEVIEEDAFQGCASLTALRIPAATWTIRPGAFSLCTSLRNLEVDPRNPCWRMEGPFLLSKAGTTLLAVVPDGKDAITIPDGVEVITQEAFSSLVCEIPITVPASVKFVQRDAFYEAARVLTFLGVPMMIGMDSFHDFAIPERIRVPRNVPGGMFRDMLMELAHDGCEIEEW